MKTAYLSLAIVLVLAGCGGGGGGLFNRDGGGGFLGRGGDRTAAQAPADDATRPTERPADGADGPADPGVPAATDDEGRFLGFSVTSLGDATVPGLWIETPLVTEEGPGRVVAPDGRTITLTLRPSGGDRGAGSRMSLAAYQALGLPLTDLPTLTIISNAG